VWIAPNRRCGLADSCLEGKAGGALEKHRPAPGGELKTPLRNTRVFPLPRHSVNRPCAMPFRATPELVLMKPEKKIIEMEDCIVTITVRPKKPAKADNDNLPYDFWTDEMKEFLDRYDK
jgi:hypothetical protein